MSLLKVGSAVLGYIAPLAETAGKIIITGGIAIAAVKTISVAGRGIGKGLDGVRHIVGYEDNIFQEAQPDPKPVARKVKRKVKPKVVKKGNVKTASGNRTAKQLAADKKRKATAKKKKAAIKAGNVGEKSVTLKK